MVAAATESIGAMFPRPLVPAYPEISSILQRAIHSVLLGQADAKTALEGAAGEVERIR